MNSQGDKSEVYIHSHPSNFKDRGVSCISHALCFCNISTQNNQNQWLLNDSFCQLIALRPTGPRMSPANSNNEKTDIMVRNLTKRCPLVKMGVHDGKTDLLLFSLVG